METKLLLGDCIEKLKEIPDNSVDAVVTDPPYELGFMGKDWDNTGIANNVQMWAQVLRVLKPGGHLLSFGGSRTYHRMVCAIEDAGFEIRDQIMWVYATGFPKSLNIGKAIDKSQGNDREVIGVKSGTYADIKRDRETGQDGLHGGIARERLRVKVLETVGTSEWEGWGSALKPAHEPIVLARKPLSEKTIVENVLKWGVGGLAIDNCRISIDPKVDDLKREVYRGERDKSTVWGSRSGFKNETNKFTGVPTEGRFPANFIHDGSNEVLELFPNSKTNRNKNSSDCNVEGVTSFDAMRGNRPARGYNSDGSAARFFYCAKASKSERDLGCNNILPQSKCEIDKMGGSKCTMKTGSGNERNVSYKNNHPTVKPVALMKYLITLITKEGQTVLDPFMGSGSTGIAAKELNRNFIGIELQPEYLEIAKCRIGSIADNTLKGLIKTKNGN